MRSFINIVFFLVCIGVVYYFSQSSDRNETSLQANRSYQRYAVAKIERLERRIEMLEARLEREKNISRQLEFRLKEINEDFIIQSDEKGQETVRFIARERVTADGGPVSEPLVKNLVEQGVNADVAGEVFERIGEKKMEILELRDQAIREGWIDSEDYQEQLSKLALVPGDIRNEFGDDVYDRYLYATGRANRILIQDIYPDSQAEYAELKPGDIVVSYDDQAIFSAGDLRISTSGGERGESVVVEVLRNGEPMRVVVARGPLGVKVDPIVQEPESNTD